jgi:Protein of unknown function (DUF3352)
MPLVRLFRIALLVALALAVSGCGAKKQASASGGAELVSASAPAFISIDSDLSSDQWQQVDKLLEKFPGYEQALAEARSSVESESGLDYEKDFKPAMGDEVNLVWLDFANGGENVVFMTKPKDADAFRRLIEKANETESEQAVFEERDGWFFLSDTQEKLDRFREESASGEKLSDDAVFKDALAELPDEALVHIYARGESIVEALQSFPGMAATPLRADQRPEFLSAALTAEGSGFRLVAAGRVEAEPKAQIEPFESKLLGDVPADAIAFLTFRGGDEFERQMEDLDKDDAYREGLDELQRMLGFRLDSLLSIFSHEVGLYVRPGSPIPEVTLLVDAPDEQEVVGRVNAAIEALTRALPAQPCHAPPEEAGVAVKCIDLGDVQLRTAAFDDKVVLTTGLDAISKLRGDGPRLGDDDGFASARDAAGMPNESVGFMWIDLEDGIPLILGLADASGTSIPAEIRANLEPLGAFLAWAETDEDARAGSFTAFLQID